MFKLCKTDNIQLGIKKIARSLELQIKCIWKTKRNTESSLCIQNSRQTTSDTHCSLQSYAGIITERIENIQIDELNYHFGEETLEECQDEPTTNKANNSPTSLQRENQYKGDKQKRYSRLETLFIKLFWKRDSTRPTSKYEFEHG